MTDLSKQEKWVATRQKGFWRYALVKFVPASVILGLASFMLASFFSKPRVLFEASFNAYWADYIFVSFGVMGLLIAFLAWHFDRPSYAMKADRQRWQNIVSKGRIHFVLVYGVLLWALPTGFLVELMGNFLSANPLSVYTALSEFLFRPSAIVWPIVGLVFGLWLWKDLNKRFSVVNLNDH